MLVKGATGGLYVASDWFIDKNMFFISLVTLSVLLAHFGDIIAGFHSTHKKASDGVLMLYANI